jgi:predicted CoA-binding protein
LTDEQYVERQQKRDAIINMAYQKNNTTIELETQAEDSLISALSQLKDKNVEVLDLCIHPSLGLAVVKQTTALGIRNVFIQPGAESNEILDYCQKEKLNVHQSCVLRELPAKL